MKEVISILLSQYIILLLFSPVLHSRTPRLRASEFSASDNKHTQILLSMGVELHYTTDVRLQLTHAPNKVCMCTPSVYAPNKVCICTPSLYAPADVYSGTCGLCLYLY